MCRYVLLLICVFTMGVGAQQRGQAPPVKPPAPPLPKPAAPAPAAVVPVVVPDASAGGQQVNIRVDVTVTDQKGTAPGQPKSVMVIIADRHLGQTRAPFEDRHIHVDARPTITNSLINAMITVRSLEGPKATSNTDQLLNWTNSFTLLLQNGKPMVALETSDAATQRKLTIEVKATILK